MLDGALGWLECTVDRAIEAGDHRILIGAVTAAHADHGHPLVFFGGAYRQLPDLEGEQGNARTRRDRFGFLNSTTGSHGNLKNHVGLAIVEPLVAQVDFQLRRMRQKPWIRASDSGSSMYFCSARRSGRAP